MSYPAKKRYTMNETIELATRASQEITNWLEYRRNQGLNSIVYVKNVENDEIYQKIDVDLIVCVENNEIYQEVDVDLPTHGNNQLIIKVEVKADRYHKTGNFFFETISNKEKGTSGCFMYTEANYIFYYFIEIKKLFILKMPEIREWFLKNQKRFPDGETTTPVGNSFYTTVGKLVPICEVRDKQQNHIWEFDL